MQNQITIVIIGGLVTALVTGLFTAWVTGLWTTKKTVIHMKYVQRDLQEIKKSQYSQAIRINRVEKDIVRLEQKIEVP